MTERLRGYFPGLSEFEVTSEADRRYNCVAWAVGRTDTWFEPDLRGRYPWSETGFRQYSLPAWRGLFQEHGFIDCTDGVLEPGREKIATFALPNGVPTHVARQLPGGRWTSKLGDLEDITHELHELAGERYGQVVLYMARPRSSATD